MSDPIINMKEVSKKFKSKQVLSNLNFDVPKGSVMGLLGKNGVGKTTLIKCALGLLRPSSGSINIFSEDVWDLSEAAKDRLGYVPQTSSFYPWLRVKEVVSYTASFYSKWNEELVNQLLSDWELKPDDKAVLLSEGQAQRLSIILALGHDPDLLVLDEPVASLDPAARRRFLKAILDIVADRECTILFSSHITSDLERVADKVAILDNGNMKFIGELDQLKDDVKRLKIAFSAAAPQNLDSSGILHSKISDGEAIAYIQGFNNEKKKQMEDKWKAQIKVEDLNLEEIFVELTR